MSRTFDVDHHSVPVGFFGTRTSWKINSLGLIFYDYTACLEEEEEVSKPRSQAVVASLIAVGVLAVVLAAGLLFVLCHSFSNGSGQQKKKGTKVAPSTYCRAMLSAENPDYDLEQNDGSNQPVDASNAQLVQRYEQSVDQQTAEKPNATPNIEMANVRPEEAHHKSEESQKQGQDD